MKLHATSKLIFTCEVGEIGEDVSVWKHRLVMVRLEAAVEQDLRFFFFGGGYVSRAALLDPAENARNDKHDL